MRGGREEVMRGGTEDGREKKMREGGRKEEVGRKRERIRYLIKQAAYFSNLFYSR